MGLPEVIAHVVASAIEGGVFVTSDGKRMRWRRIFAILAGLVLLAVIVWLGIEVIEWD